MEEDDSEEVVVVLGLDLGEGEYEVEDGVEDGDEDGVEDGVEVGAGDTG